MKVPRRKISELLALYFAQPNLLDLFVEGASDKTLLDSLFVNPVFGRCIHAIDDLEIDLPEVSGENGARGRVVLVSKELLRRELAQPFCMVDRDNEVEAPELWQSNNLLFTSHACLDMHIYDTCRLEKQIKKAFGKKVALGQIESAEEVAKFVFAVRIERERAKFAQRIPDITDSLRFKEGSVSIDVEHFLSRCDNTLKNPCARSEFARCVERVQDKLIRDGRKWMNIHDLEAALQFCLRHLAKIDMKQLGATGWLSRYLRMDHFEALLGNDQFIHALGGRYHAI